MKNKLSGLLVITILVSAMYSFISCSQEIETSQTLPDKTQEFQESKLISEIKSTNKGLLKSHASTAKKSRNRPGWSRKETINVVLSDCAGAWKGAKGGVNIGSKIGLFFGQPHTAAIVGGIIGGVICGGAASWLAAPEKKQQATIIKAISLSTPDSTNISFPFVAEKFSPIVDGNMNIRYTEITASQEIKNKIEIDDSTLSKINLNKQQLDFGKMHNILLSELEREASIIESELCHSDDSVYNTIINCDDMKTLYDHVLTDTKNNVYFGSDTKSEYVMQLFSEIFKEYAENGGDITIVINKYAQLINETDELNEGEKNCILSGLATALYSLHYWNPTSINE